VSVWRANLGRTGAPRQFFSVIESMPWTEGGRPQGRQDPSIARGLSISAADGRNVTARLMGPHCVDRRSGLGKRK
jgi:hypothetical protein